MKIYFINDLHWDFWRREGYTLEKYFDQYFLPADVCCVAGDIANDFDKFFISRTTSAIYLFLKKSKKNARKDLQTCRQVKSGCDKVITA